GCSTGGGGFGRSACRLYQNFGILDSSRTYLTASLIVYLVCVSPRSAHGRQSLDHFARAQSYRLGYGDADVSGRIEVNCQPHPADGLDREVLWICSTEYLMHVSCGHETGLTETYAVANQGSLGDNIWRCEHGRHSLGFHGVDDELALAPDHRVIDVKEGIRVLGLERSHARSKLLDGRDLSFDDLDLQLARRISRRFDSQHRGP